MSRFVFSAEARAAFRSAITSHPQWESYRVRNGLSAASLTTDQLLSAGATFGLNPLDFGAREKSARGRFYGGSPKPKPYDFTASAELKKRFDAIADLLTQKQRDFAADIFATVYEKQDGTMTARQYQIIADMVARVGNPAATNPPPAYSAPVIIDSPANPTPAPAIPPHVMAPTPIPAIAGDAGQQLAAVIQSAIGAAIATAAPALDESRVIALIKAHGGSPAHVTLDLRTPAGVEPIGEALMHHKFPLLLAGLQAGVNMMLVGPAGSGKTEGARQAAKILGREFYFTGAIDSPYKLTGFIDAQGRYVRTPFREAFEHGGLFLWDEIDGSLPAAMTPFNAALANEYMDFPDGIIKKHPNFVAIAAANTFGRGSDRQYVGRFQLDAATLDRFVMLSWEYDSALESAIVGLPRPDDAPAPVNVSPIFDAGAMSAHAAQWAARVQAVRARLELNKIRHVVSPRATINGIKLIAAGWPRFEIEESVLWKGLDSDSRRKAA
jgi:hypothetical protein